MADPDRESAAALLQQLTRREQQVLTLIAEGLTVAEIARRLHRSTKTIESHRLSLGRKLGLDNRVKLARLAIEAELASVPGIERDWAGRDRKTDRWAGTGNQPEPEQASGGGLGPFEDEILQTIEACGDGLALINAQARILFANARACEILAASRHRLIGRLASDFVSPEQRRWYQQLLTTGLAKPSRRLRPWLLRSDGQRVPVRLVAEGLFDRDRQFRGTLARLTELGHGAALNAPRRAAAARP
jgi:PAS domain S-box-containing protein